jgi:hypothetical protein
LPRRNGRRRSAFEQRQQSGKQLRWPRGTANVEIDRHDVMNVADNSIRISGDAAVRLERQPLGNEAVERQRGDCGGADLQLSYLKYQLQWHNFGN